MCVSSTQNVHYYERKYVLSFHCLETSQWAKTVFMIEHFYSQIQRPPVPPQRETHGKVLITRLGHMINALP